MAELKTKANDGDVDAFIAAVENPQRQADARELRTLMEKITGEPAVMWGSSIVGFGRTRAVYASGREVDWLAIGFSPRKANLSLYLTCDADRLAEPLEDLGTYTRGKGCIYVKELSDVDAGALNNLIEIGYAMSGT